MFSIRSSLLYWLIIPLVTVSMVGAGITYWLASAPARIAFDQSLADAAWALIPHLRSISGHVETDLSNQAEQVLRVDHFDAIYLVVRDAKGHTITGDKDFPPLAMPAKFDSPFPYDGQMRGEPIRIISLRTSIDGDPVSIGVAETMRKRHDMQSRIAETLLIAEIILIAISITVVRFAVARGVHPLQAMRSTLDARSHEDLSSVNEDGLPVELKPFVKAINDLLRRADTGAKARQEFLANLAHQLRTPLAGFRTQLEWIQKKFGYDPTVSQPLALMATAVERMIRQTNQFLALARAEPSQFEKKRLEAVELDKLVEEAVQHFVQEASQKHIDLGFDLHPVTVKGDRFLLRDLIDNLIDNAIRYSPEKGTVTVKCENAGDTGLLTVEDNGPGIPPNEQEKIFDRYYRLHGNASGSGLGLAIVRDIARDHDAAIQLMQGLNGRGTTIAIRFPLNAK